MKTIDIMKESLTGIYEVTILLENHSHPACIECCSLHEAIKLANSLTWERCMNKCNHTDNDVFGNNEYGIDVLLKRDIWSTDCENQDGIYPIIWSVSVRR